MPRDYIPTKVERRVRQAARHRCGYCLESSMAGDGSPSTRSTPHQDRIGLPAEAKIPFRLVGQLRRVRLDDPVTFNRKDDAARRRPADDVPEHAQGLGMGY